MIFVDTNVVLRFIVQDDPKQFKVVQKLFREETIFISSSVILEVEWVLRDAYGFSKEPILLYFRSLLNHQQITIENSDELSKALTWFDTGMDFADAFHLAFARGCFATFDKRLVNRVKSLENIPEAYIPV